MSPLLSQHAAPDAVRQRLGVDGVTYPGHRGLDILAGVLEKTGSGVDEIRRAADRAESVQVYRIDLTSYFAFYDGERRLTQYVCVSSD